MELVGEENRIRTLFSELRLADEQAAPSFAATWNRAQIKSVKRRGFNLALVAATTLLLCGVVSLAWWSTHSTRPQTSNSVAVSDSTLYKPSTVKVANGESEQVKPASTTNETESKSKSRSPRAATRRQVIMLAADRKVLRDAQAISNWQSPSAALLPSSNNDLLKSLPELDENSKGMKSFLPNK
jgi:hypothetical protein